MPKNIIYILIILFPGFFITQGYAYTGDFKNIYHENIPNTFLDQMDGYIAKYTLGNALGTGNSDTWVEQAIPIYLPTQNIPKTIQLVWNKNNGDYFGMSAMNLSHPEIGSMGIRGLNGGRFYLVKYSEPTSVAYLMIKPQNEAYLKSQQAPFKNAPQIQFYLYLGWLLLVARDTTGMVTDVFFQNRPNIVDPMTRAKKYLGPKWYHP